MALPVTASVNRSWHLSVKDQYLEMEWYCPVSEEELADAYLEGLQLSLELGLKKWLIDVRKQDCCFVSQYNWVARQFYPRLMQYPDGHICFAYVLSAEQYQDVLRLNNGSAEVAHNSYLRMHVFQSPEDAAAWLLEAQQLLSAG